MKGCQSINDKPKDKSIIATKTNGGLGNQMSAFATLYSVAKLSSDRFRVGVNYKQFELLSNAFRYFDYNYEKHLMDSWYCLKPSDFIWTYLGNT